MNRQEVDNYLVLLVFSIIALIWIWCGFKIALTVFIANCIINILFKIKISKKDDKDKGKN